MTRSINNLITDLRLMSRPVWILIAGQFINRFGAFVFPFLTLFLLERGYHPGEVSVVLAAGACGNFLGPVLGGYLTDAIGRRNTIVLSLVGGAITLVSIYFCQSLPTLILISLANGCVHFAFGPAASALLTDLVPETKRVTAFALLRLAINAGFAAGPTVAGILYATAPWLIFVGDAATTLVFATLAWYQLPHGLRTIEGSATSPRMILQSWIAAWNDLRGNAAFVQYLLSILLMATAFVQVFNTLAATADDRGLSPTTYGMIMGLNGLIICMVELPLVRWLERFPARRVLAAGFALVGAGCATFTFATDAGSFVVAMVIFTIGEIIALPIGMAYSSNLAPKAYRGRYFGFRGMTWAFAGLLGSSGVWFHGWMGPVWWFIVSLSAFGGAAVILPAWRQRAGLTATVR